MPGFGPRLPLRAERSYADETPLATTFRVYTPAEIRTSRPRASIVLPAPPPASLTAGQMARGAAIGAGVIAGLFAAFLVVGNLTDDARRAGEGGATGTAALRAPAAAVPLPPALPVSEPVALPLTPSIGPMIVIGDPPTDLELPDDAPRRAAKAKAKKRRVARPN